MTKSKNGLLLLLLSVILLSLSFFSVKIGEVALSSIDILDALLGRVADNPTVEFIVNSRLNRTVVAVLAGGALAVSGLILQVFFRNPLAGPGVLGISSGAALGVAVVLLGGVIVNSVSGYTLTIFAGVSGALLVLFLLLMMSRYIYQMVTLLVIGLMLSYFSSALLNILFQWADTEATRAFVVWSLGSFEGLTNNEVGIFTLVILTMLGLSFVLVKPLNALALGPEYAASLGINLRSVRFRMILITGVLTAIVTVFCGPIGFLGMAVPQLSRQISKNQNQLFLIPLTILIGAIFALVADMFVRILSNGIPLNTATSLIGAPIIIWVIFKLNKRRF